MSEPFLELTSQPLFRAEHGRALHLEVVLLSVVPVSYTHLTLPTSEKV